MNRKINRKYTLNFISKLIDPNTKSEELKLIIINTNYFWAEVVKEGSKHLLLPTIYFCAIEKKIDEYIPEDLLLYLNNISSLNSNRNLEIVKQIKSVSKLLNKNKIKHVFLKGAAFLIRKPYDVIKQRMIGDIDILVDEKMIKKTQKLLISEGYKENKILEKELKNNIIKHRHEDRLVHNDYIAALEIHSFLLSEENKFRLRTSNVMKSKIKIDNIFWIPSDFYLWKHAILNHLYNDKGIKYNWLHFRTVLDVIHLEEKFIQSEKNLNYSIKSFYSLMSVFFKYQNSFYTIKKKIYEIQLNSTLFSKFLVLSIKISEIMKIILNRLILFIFNQGYRVKILKNPIIVYKILKNHFYNNKP